MFKISTISYFRDLILLITYKCWVASIVYWKAKTEMNIFEYYPLYISYLI